MPTIIPYSCHVPVYYKYTEEMDNTYTVREPFVNLYFLNSNDPS